MVALASDANFTAAAQEVSIWLLKETQSAV
jgi:hypothetical protein